TFPEVPLDGTSEDWSHYLDATAELEETSPRPIIEPLRTWPVGQFDGDLVQISLVTLEWLGKRTVPLQSGEIEELRAYLAQTVKRDLK
ncbi:MAG: hypothetical protein KY445_16495, partial [Armatimonadetes bacterium]|nr:hypothetical protein [Armatimonadota bacterium]